VKTRGRGVTEDDPINPKRLCLRVFCFHHPLFLVLALLRGFMENKEILFKVVAFIERDELDFLDQISKDIYFTNGKKIPRTELIKEIIHLMKNSKEFKDLIENELLTVKKEAYHA
jgi:hypothetical protein